MSSARWVALVLVVTPLVHAQVELGPPSGDPRWELEPLLQEREPCCLKSATLMWTNDGRFFNPTQDRDRHFTNGTELDLAIGKPWPIGVEDILPPLLFDDFQSAGGIAFGQHIFTPADLESTELIVDDRPYAGWLYAGLYVQRRDNHHMDHLELNVGIVGEWSGAEAAQKFVHSVLPDQIRPSGWDNQLANELGVNFHYLHRWRTNRVQVGAFHADAVPQVGFDLGNVATNANAAIMGRIGWNLPDDFGPDSMRDYTDQLRVWDGQWGVYLFTRLGGRAVARDIFLDGNTFANSHSVDKMPLVGELQAGLMARYHWLELGWSITWFTEEFEGQQGGGDAIGAYVIRARFEF